MKSHRACPYCKSPARGNPCWYFLDHPDVDPGGGDPPCMLYSDDAADLYVRDAARDAAAQWHRRLIIAICLSLAALVVAVLRAKGLY